MESPRRDGKLIDFDNPNKYSIRTLKFICEKNSIKIPMWPDKKQLISALETHQKILDVKQQEEARKRQAIKESQKINNQFNTPILPMSLDNSADNAFPTPILCSRRTPSELPDKRTSIDEPIPHSSPIINALAAEEKYLKMQERKERGPYYYVLISTVVIVFIIVVIIIIGL